MGAIVFYSTASMPLWVFVSVGVFALSHIKSLSCLKCLENGKQATKYYRFSAQEVKTTFSAVGTTYFQCDSIIPFCIDIYVFTLYILYYFLLFLVEKDSIFFQKAKSFQLSEKVFNFASQKDSVFDYCLIFILLYYYLNLITCQLTLTVLALKCFKKTKKKQG